MKAKIIINPKYSELNEFISTIPDIIQHEGTVVQNRRNLIKSLNFNKYDLNVKRFRVPILINRIIYTFLRRTKAFRAYYNALEVKERGFDTPESIAYIEYKKNGLLWFSYFVSHQIHNVSEIRKYYFSEIDGNEHFLKSFAKYTASLHNADILHLDYSPGNILIKEDEPLTTFFLVDINRMKFGKINIIKGCSNFARLFEHDNTVAYLASIYAEERNFDVSESIRIALKYKHRFEKKKERKNKLKKFLKSVKMT